MRGAGIKAVCMTGVCMTGVRTTGGAGQPTGPLDAAPRSTHSPFRLPGGDASNGAAR